jgi:precorrin-6B methylase 2
MKTFRIIMDQKVEVWQNNVHVVSAESEEDAIELIKKNPQEFCVETETLDNTEEVIENNFKDNFEIEEV